MSCAAWGSALNAALSGSDQVGGGAAAVGFGGSAAGTSACPVDDNSTLNENLAYFYDYAYTPTWGSSGVAPAVGDGQINGFFSRSGNLVSVKIQLICGAASEGAKSSRSDDPIFSRETRAKPPPLALRPCPSAA